jgi:imidazolonepropionase-like amidohydrolase
MHRSSFVRFFHFAWIALVGTLALVGAAPEARGAASQPQPQPQPQTFVVRHARVFDGARTVASTDVYVRDGMIVAVGRNLAVPAGVPSVDGTGRTLLPGLIDAHTHSYGTARRDALRFGVTTELDMFGDYRQIAAAKRDREQHAPVEVADLWSAGTLATVPHGHGTEYGFPIPTLTTPEEAPAFVTARFAEGSDYLKIILEDGSAFGHSLPSLDAPTTNALVAAAHAAHRMAVAHVATEAEADEAVDAHIDGLAHVFMDRVTNDETVRRLRAGDTFVTATLSVAATAARANFGQTLVDDPRLAPWLARGQTASLRAQFPSDWARAPLLPNAIENVRRLHAAGVTILAGTDAGNPGTAHGASLHGELELLVRAGLTPTQALAAATALPAARFQLGDRGRIAPGMRADLLLVDGDPTVDITATRSIVAIWKNGAAVDRALADDEKPALGKVADADPLIADFEDGRIAVRHGQNWAITTDQLAGGKSTAQQEWIAGGADGSKGALRVSGVVDPAFPFAWAGTLYMPGDQPFEAVDFGDRTMLTFNVRGDARGLSVMVFSGEATQRVPTIVRFDATAQWSEVRIGLGRFEGADFHRLRGLAFTAGLPAGPFSFEIDDVRIR